MINFPSVREAYLSMGTPATNRGRTVDTERARMLGKLGDFPWSAPAAHVLVIEVYPVIDLT